MGRVRVPLLIPKTISCPDAILQKRHSEAGSIARVPAPDVESIVIKALRDPNSDAGNDECPALTDDCDLIEHQVDRIVVRPQAIEIHVLVKADGEQRARNRDGGIESAAGNHSPTIITVPWSATSGAATKGPLWQLGADSDEVARAFRDDVARYSDMMPPGSVASLAYHFLH